MLRYLLDTDHLTLYSRAHPTVVQHTSSHKSAVVISVVTAYETLGGRLAQISRAKDGPTRIRRYALLEHALQLLAQFQMGPFDQAAEDEFQRLRSIRIGTQDLKIASIALANQLIVVACNRRDFSRLPGLTIEDWSI
jgi:tRNA(fMet)-specific endonuclease VapC